MERVKQKPENDLRAEELREDIMVAQMYLKEAKRSGKHAETVAFSKLCELLIRAMHEERGYGFYKSY